MATTKTIAQIVEQIRTAIFGRDVRENLADGIEKCYDDVTNGVTTADAAAAKIDGMTVAANDLTPGSTATATVSEVSGHKHIAFGIPKGDKGDKGDTGDPFYIAKTYSTVSAMNSDFSGSDTHVGDYVMIIGDNNDKGKIYRKGSSSWTYVTNLIGPKGDKGDKGNTGDTGPVPTITTQVTGIVPYDRASEASVTIDNTDVNHPILKFVLPQGPTGSVGTITGSDIPVSSSNSTKISEAINSKASRPGSAVNGNFAALDGLGNITDSGHKHSDYLTSHQNISGKIDKVQNADTYIPVFNSNGGLAKSNYTSTDLSDFNSKMNGITEPIEDTVPIVVDATHIVSSEYTISDLVKNDSPLILMKQYECTKTYAKTTNTGSLSIGDFGITGIEGYTPLCISTIATGVSSIYIRSFNTSSLINNIDVDSTATVFTIRKITTDASVTTTYTLGIVFIRNDILFDERNTTT